MITSNQVIVAIPARNEQDYIGRCLTALTKQTHRPDWILLFLNNCSDGTATISKLFAQQIGLVIHEECLTGELATAGEARRRSLMLAAAQFPSASILTTDADSCAPSDWIEANLRALSEGADVVCGQAELYPQDAALIKCSLQFDDMKETFLAHLLDEIDSLINPICSDPLPRHTQESGASICLRAGVLQKIGGAPSVPSGEDRALVDLCRMNDLKIRHDPRIVVHVSGRLEGRAVGGMAETIKRRTHRQDELTDSQIEPAIDAYRRSLAKSRLYACWTQASPSGELATDLLLDPGFLSTVVESPFFGSGWDAVQSLSPMLQRRRVAYSDLARETRQALRIRGDLLKEASTTTSISQPSVDHAI